MADEHRGREEVRRALLEILSRDEAFRDAIEKLLVASLADRVYVRLSDYLAARFARVEGRIESVEEHVVELKARVELLEEKLEAIESILSAVREDIVYEARMVVSERLKQRGIEVSLVPLQLPGVGGIDFYGDTGRVVVVGDAYSLVSSSSIKRTLSRAAAIVDGLPDMLGGGKRIVIAVYGLRVLSDSIGAALKAGVWLLDALRDYTSPSLLSAEEVRKLIDKL